MSVIAAVDGNQAKYHLNMAKRVLKMINQHCSCFVLTGESALTICYGLTKMPEVLQLAAVNTRRGISDLLEVHNWKYKLTECTDEKLVYEIDYSGTKPLKIEISYTSKFGYYDNFYQNEDGIRAYTINDLALFNVRALIGASNIRDVYDMIYICLNYWDELSPFNKENIRHLFEFKDANEYMDYVCSTQVDDDIDKMVLRVSFNDMLKKIGLV